MIDDKPCPRCYSLDRTNGDSDKCWSCGLYMIGHIWHLPDGQVFDYAQEVKTRRYGWSILRGRQGQAAQQQQQQASALPGRGEGDA